MALRRAKPETENQLELFAPTGKTHERTHTVRTDGRETLAPVLPQDGEGTRSQGTPGTDGPRPSSPPLRGASVPGVPWLRVPSPSWGKTGANVSLPSVRTV